MHEYVGGIPSLCKCDCIYCLSFFIFAMPDSYRAAFYFTFQVDLMRSFTFRNSKGSYRGIPIIAANMDTVGTFEMAVVLHQV